jgi:hypothetical protein
MVDTYCMCDSQGRHLGSRDDVAKFLGRNCQGMLKIFQRPEEGHKDCAILLRYRDTFFASQIYKLRSGFARVGMWISYALGR